jgi:hypothetical protein
MWIEGCLRTKYWGKYLTCLVEGRKYLTCKVVGTGDLHDFCSSPKAGRVYVMDHKNGEKWALLKCRVTNFMA